MKKPELIQDLGMLYPLLTSKVKKHFAMYNCPFCNKKFKSCCEGINSGRTVSCGCYIKRITTERNFVHGLSKTSLYKVFKRMKQRCYNKDCNDYLSYGARGITIYKKWINNPILFVKWSIKNGYKKDLKIDRINNDGNYEPSNCRWTTQNIQSQNSRLINKTNKSGYRGVYLCGNKFRANITSNNKKYFLGYYKSKENAAIAYNNFVIEHKTFHTLNKVHT